MQRLSFSPAILKKSALCFCCLTLSSILNAVELSVTLNSNTRYSNNIEQTSIESEKIDEVIETLILDTLLEERRKKFTLAVNASFQHERFLNSTYSNQSELATGVGLVNFQVIESFLDWKSSYRRVRVLKDSELPEVPTNIAVRDVYTSGPQVYYAIDKLTDFTVNSTYTQTEISDPNAQDTKRLDSRVGLGRRLGKVSHIGLTFGATRMLDAEGGDEFEMRNWAFTFDREIVRGGINLGFGTGRFISQTGTSTRTLSYDFAFKKEVFFHGWTLKYKSVTTDTSSIVTVEEEKEVDSGELPGVDIEVNDVYEEDQYRFSLNRDLEEFTYRVDGYYVDRDYMKDDRHDILYGFTSTIGYQVQPGLDFDMSWTKALSRDAEQPQEGKLERNTYKISGNYDVSKELALAFYLQYFEKQNDHESNDDNEELSLGLNVKWKIK